MKRGNGEDSITKRRDGRWTARYVVHTQKGQKRRALYGKTRKEVAEKLAEALNGSRRNGGRSAKEDSVATGDFLKRWLRDCVKDSISETSIGDYLGVLQANPPHPPRTGAGYIERGSTRGSRLDQVARYIHPTERIASFRRPDLQPTRFVFDQYPRRAG